MSKQHKKRSASSISHDDHVFVKKSLEERGSIVQNRTDDDGEISLQKSTSGQSDKKQKSFQQPKKRSADEISENLAAIYQNQDGSLPDMKNFQKTKRVKIVRAFFQILLLGIFSIALAFGIMYVWQGKNKGKEDIVLVVTGAEKIKIGQSVTFQVRYRNPQSVPISKASLSVRYPDGFVFEKSSLPPTNDTNDEWKLGTLEGNQSGVIDITGRVSGSVSEQQSLRVFLNYLPANFSSEFQKVSTLSFTLTDSPIRLTVQGPTETTYGATVPIEVTVQKEPDFEIALLALTMESPEGFVKKSSEPQSDSLSDSMWTLSNKATTSTIHLKGTFLTPESAVSSTLPVTFRVIGYRTPQKTGSPLVLGEFTYTPSLLHTALEIRSAVNGAVTQANVVPGENLTSSFVLKNTGEVPIKNIEFSAVFDAPAYNKQSILNWKEIQDEEQGTITAKSLDDTRRQGTITWTSRQISDLKSLAPGKEVRVDVILPIKKDQEDADKYSVWNIEVSSEARYELGTEKKTISSNPISLTLNSDLALEVRDELSGEKNEVHLVTWLLSNTYHPLKDIELSIEVYGDTEFDESKLTVPAGTASFDAEKKIFTWKIPEMPIGIDVHALQFVLRSKTVNPSQTQLTSKVKVKAFDMVTQKEVILAGDEVLMNVPQEEKEKQN